MMPVTGNLNMCNTNLPRQYIDLCCLQLWL